MEILVGLIALFWMVFFVGWVFVNRARLDLVHDKLPLINSHLNAYLASGEARHIFEASAHSRALCETLKVKCGVDSVATSAEVDNEDQR